MQQLLKRLELIKTCITLEDEEIIELQVIKLKALENDADVLQILKQLEQQQFSKALSRIDDYISRHTGLTAYEDPLLQSLKLELKVLERQLQSLNEHKNECDTDIEEFNSEYTLNLGDVIQQVLRAQIFQQQLQAKQQAFEQSKAEYNEIKSDLNKLKSELVDKEAELEELEEFSDDYEDEHAAYEELKSSIIEK
jgi:chromosome segregation ATPase